jgi:hypothetical protein
VEKELDEPVLENDYPVYFGYCYVCNGVAINSPVAGTVADLKRNLNVQEVRRCDMAGRGFFSPGTDQH